MSSPSPTTAAKRVVRLDASSLKDSHCIRKLYLRTVQGFRSRGNQPNDIFYGTAFHRFAEELERRPADAANIMADVQQFFYNEDTTKRYGKDYLDVVHLSTTCMNYVALLKTPDLKWNNADILRAPADCEGYSKGDPLVEVKFSFPVCVTPTTEFLLQGTIDRISKIRGGCLVLEDFKTTATKEPELFWKQHRMSPQGMTYVFAVMTMAASNPNGMFASLLRGQPRVGFRIKGVFLDPKNATRFECSDPFFYEPSELEDYYNELYSLCRALEVSLSLTTTLPPAQGRMNDTCRSSFGSYCPYLDACQNSGKIGRDGVLSVLGAHMKQELYEPLNFGGGKKGDKKV